MDDEQLPKRGGERERERREREKSILLSVVKVGPYLRVPVQEYRLPSRIQS